MYILYRFNTLTLPDKMPSDDNSTGVYATSPYALSTGGAYDALGTEQAYPVGARKFNKTALFHFSDTTEMRNYHNSIRNLVGTTSRLYRQWVNGNVEWVTARFISIDSVRTIENQTHLEIGMSFEIYSHYWHGEYLAAWVFDSGEYFDTGLLFDSGGDSVTLDASPKSFTITMDGNAIVNDPKITILAGGANITALEIKNTTTGHLAELDYSGTITSAQSLVIDCAAYTVKNNGSADEANFSLGATHGINEWFRFAPGANTIVVTFTGGSNDSTIDFDYYEGWK